MGKGVWMERVCKEGEGEPFGVFLFVLDHAHYSLGDLSGLGVVCGERGVWFLGRKKGR